MSDVSIGSNDTAQGKNQPTDAQTENEHDIGKGLEGTEAKPFRPTPENVAPGDAETKKQDPSLVSGKRTAGRE